MLASRAIRHQKHARARRHEMKWTTAITHALNIARRAGLHGGGDATILQVAVAWEHDGLPIAANLKVRMATDNIKPGSVDDMLLNQLANHAIWLWQ